VRPSIALIPNIRAGRGTALRLARQADGNLPEWELNVITPASAEGLTQACAGLDPSRMKAAIVLGGDGTCNRAIRGLTTSGVPLYPFPAGLANDLHGARGLRQDWAQVGRLLASGSHAPADLVEVNGIPFATVGGLGGAAEVVARFDAFRAAGPIQRRLVQAAGADIYSLIAARILALGPPVTRRLRLQVDGETRILDLMTLLVARQTVLGGTLNLGPSQAPEGGFTVIALPAGSRLRHLRQLAALRLPWLGSDGVAFGARELVVEDLSGRPLQAFGDGEILVEAPRVVFQVRRAALRIYEERGFG
jgi:diacylglycerol kinase family enzyme